MGLPSEDDDKQAQTEQLYKAINRLGNIEKALIMLYLDENSYEQIAEITGLSKANVGVKIMRIKNKLKSMLNE